MTRKTQSEAVDDALNVALCTCSNIRKAARVITQLYEGALQPAGLKATQFSLIAVLSKAGQLPMTALAGAMVMDRTTLTRNLKPLVASGLVKIESQEDQRVRMVSLTEKGLEKFDEAYPLWSKAQSKIVDGFGTERWSGFISDLDAMVDVARGN